MTAEENELVTENPASRLSLGETLAQLREQKKLTVEDVSNHLRLGVKQVMAIEANDFSQLPEAMITRGFIRNYAKFLNIDADTLIDATPELAATHQSISLNVSAGNIPIEPKKNYGLLKLLLALLLLAGLIVWANQYLQHVQINDLAQVFSSEQNTSPSEVSAPAMPAPASETVPAENSVDASSVANSDANAEGTASAPASSEESPSNDANNQTPNEPQEANQASSTTENVAPSAMDMQIQLSFNEASWVSAVDGDNKTIYEQLNQPSTSQVISGKSPIKLHIGNARGTKVIYKNQEVDLSQYSKNNVARLTLSLERN